MKEMLFTEGRSGPAILVRQTKTLKSGILQDASVCVSMWIYMYVYM